VKIESVAERVADAVTYALGLGVLVVNALRVARYLQSTGR
jgi:hypothetical protein